MDDNGSEEDYSYEELCQATPRYLQPGGEQLAINEVTSGASRCCGGAWALRGRVLGERATAGASVAKHPAAAVSWGWPERGDGDFSGCVARQPISLLWSWALTLLTDK